MSEPYSPSARTRVIREPHRGVYDRATAYQILDQGFICHVGFMVDNQPFVIPTAYGRAGDNLYIGDRNDVVRQVDLASGYIVTLAGGGTASAPGYGDGSLATSASLGEPRFLVATALKLAGMPVSLRRRMLRLPGVEQAPWGGWAGSARAYPTPPARAS